MQKENLKSCILVSSQELNSVQQAAGSQDLSEFASRQIGDALARKFGLKRRKNRDSVVLQSDAWGAN